MEMSEMASEVVRYYTAVLYRTPFELQTLFGLVLRCPAWPTCLALMDRDGKKLINLVFLNQPLLRMALKVAL